jgi:chitinase
MTKNRWSIARRPAVAALLLLSCGPAPDSEDDGFDDLDTVEGEIANGTYTLQAVHSGKCAEVAGSSLSDGAGVQQWSCSSTKLSQRWKVTDLGNGYARVTNANSNKCLDVYGASTADGAKIQQWSCNTGYNQQWKVLYIRDGYYELKPRHSGKCMDVKGISTSDGGPIHQWVCRDVAQQHWRIKAVSSGSTGLGAILSEATFNKMFPSRNSFYSYAGLIEGAKKYPAFATTGDTTTRKREVAAFLANVGHETGDLRYIKEISPPHNYCSSSSSCPCASGKSYYGRGPIQLSWNYNYCSAGSALGYDLRGNPDLVSSNATVAWATGFWFWMTQTGAGRYTCHNAIVNALGFGETIRTINGALECGGRNPAQVQSRIDRYKAFCALLGVTPGSNLSC